MDGNDTGSYPQSLVNVSIWNNVFLEGNTAMSNGFIGGQGNNTRILNNTFVGSGITNSTAIYMSGTGMSIANNIVSGVTTFITSGPASITFANGGLNNNLYANATPGGNPPFLYKGISYNTLAAWRAATGGDTNSSQVTSALLTGSGHRQPPVRLLRRPTSPHTSRQTKPDFPDLEELILALGRISITSADADANARFNTAATDGVEAPVFLI